MAKNKEDQYLWTPLTEEEIKKHAQEDVDRRAAYSLDNLPPDAEMPFNNNYPHSIEDQDSFECVAEHMNVHNYAIEQINKAPQVPAWDTYKKVVDSYRAYIKSGKAPDPMLDPASIS